MAFWRYDLFHRVAMVVVVVEVVAGGGRGDQQRRAGGSGCGSKRLVVRDVGNLTTQRGTHRSESCCRERERVSRGRRAFCRSEVVDPESGERQGVVGGRGVQWNEQKANERQAGGARRGVGGDVGASRVVGGVPRME